MIKLKYLIFMATAVAISSCDSSNSNDDEAVDSFTPPEINGYMLTSLTATDGNEQVLSRSVYKFDDIEETSFTKYILDINDEEVADVKYDINSNGTISSQEILSVGADTIQQKQLLAYDTTGRLSRIENSIGEISEVVEFQYQGDQIDTKTITSTVESDALVFAYSYNEAQDLESIRENDSVNEIVNTMFLFYDGDKQLERAEYDELSDGEIEEVRVFGRDGNGNVATINYYDEDNELVRVETFGYKRADSPVVNLVEFDNYYFLL